MKHINLKTFLVISLVLLLIISPVTTYANGNPLPNAGNFIAAGRPIDENGNHRDLPLNTPELVDKMDESLGGGLVSILALLYKVGVLVAVCVFAFMGVKFVIASPQQKAQLKASLFPYFIGLLLFVAGVPIATAIINIFLQLL